MRENLSLSLTNRNKITTSFTIISAPLSLSPARRKLFNQFLSLSPSNSNREAMFPRIPSNSIISSSRNVRLTLSRFSSQI